MTKEEYITKNSIDQYFDNLQYSEPKYDCPECGSGHMRKKLSIILTSNPPMFQYECDTCGYIEYLNF